MFSNLTEVGREVNLFLGIVTLVWLLNRRIFNRHLYTNNVRKDMWLIATSWCAALSVGTFEQLFHTGTSIRVALSTIALVVTIRLLLRKKDEWYAMRNGGDHVEKIDECP